MTISAVINTLNEEAHLAECLASVRGFADEIVVCDMHSDDRTAEIAVSLGARVVPHPRTGFVEPARRFAIEQARGEWVLVLDADERLTPALAERLRQAAAAGDCDVVAFWSRYWYFGGWVRHGDFYRGDWARFFRRAVYLRAYTEAETQVHHNFLNLLREPRLLRLPPEYHILHYAYPTIEKYLTKTLGMYACLEAEQRHRQGQRFSLRRLLGRPVAVFVRSYLLRQGFRDGLRGLILNVLYAGYHFAIWANVWLLEQQARRPAGAPPPGAQP